MKEQIEFRKIREFGDIIGDTFVFIKQNFKPLLKAFLTLCGVFILGGILSSLFMQLNLFSNNGTINIASSYSSGWGRLYNLGVSYIFMVVFMMLNYTSMYIAVLSYISIYIQKGNQQPSVAEVWAYFKYYFFRVLGSSLLIGIFFVVCLICCLIPGIYVFPAITLFFPIMIMENGNFSHAFSRSFALVKNEWWITAATLMVIYIIFYAFSFVVQLPAYIILMISAFSGAEGMITRSYAVAAAVGQQAAQVFLIIPIVCAALCYYNLVERKESSGLMGRIDGFGQANNQDNSSPEEY